MKIAIFGESSADEAAVAILIGAILGQVVEQSGLPSLKARGVSQMINELPRVIRSLHFNSDAFGLVMVLDSNGKAIHVPQHDKETDPECRLCKARGEARRELDQLGVRPAGERLRFGVGLAVPAIEAWLLSASEAGMSEANWTNARRESPPREPFNRRQLKEMLYGTAVPSLELETTKMTEHMTEVVKDFERLRAAFPGGFGPLYDEIRSWK